MYTCDKPSDLLDRLREMPMFSEVEDEPLRWLIDCGEFICVPKDEVFFHAGEVIEHMDIILRGSYLIRRMKDGKRKELGIWEAPYVMGILPFSRMTSAAAEGLTLEPIQMLRIHKSHFVEMVNVSYELVQSLVGIMTDRVRDFTNMNLMDEKLMALGKMSAGLAHELNNPASAIVRSGQELHKHLGQTPERFKAVISMPVEPASVDVVNQVLFDRIQNCRDTSDLSLLEREELNDALEDWMEDHQVVHYEDILDTFIDYDFGPEQLDAIAGAIPPEALAQVLAWVETNLVTESLVGEIQTASARIADLVTSIKSYSHMDSEPSMEFRDVHKGIKSTLTMLKFKFKRNNVTLKKDLGHNLPHVKVLEGELNQVWTNLLANALDVMPADGTGEIRIRSFQRRDNLCVEIEDNGPGIPEDIQSRVFDPFFTTKGIGEGTGMGLDIVRRVLKHHGGSVSLESEPGRTCFRVCLPL